MSKLRSASSQEWLDFVMAHFDGFLADHANCERKAHATALAFVVRHPDKHDLVTGMLDLAREELLHFQQVYELMHSRNLALVADTKDPYVNALRQLMRTHHRQHAFLDRLCVGAIIEARGCERFGLIAQALPSGPLRAFYETLTRSEARHAGLFTRIAKRYIDPSVVDARLAELFAAEADIVAHLALRPALH